MIGLLLLLFAGLIVGVVLLTAYTAYALTHPPRRTYASALAAGRAGDPSEIGPDWGGPRVFEEWTFRSRSLELPAWDVQGEDPAGPVVIVSHGWGDSRVGGLSRVAALAKFASRVVLWDMPGHGDSSGTCALGTREVDDLLALIEKLRGPRGIVLYGWSLGAGVSIAAAARESAGIVAVVAEGAYRLPPTPARNMIRRWGLPWRVNLPLALGCIGQCVGVGWGWRGFDRAALARVVRAPMLVLHGEFDEISPVEDGQDIAAASGAQLAVIPGAGHYGLWTEADTRETCTRAVQEFVKRALKRPDLP